jgi:hypothetical protein
LFGFSTGALSYGYFRATFGDSASCVVGSSVELKRGLPLPGVPGEDGAWRTPVVVLEIIGELQNVTSWPWVDGADHADPELETPFLTSTRLHEKTTEH